MEHSMERWYMLAGQRFSVRKFAGQPQKDAIAELKAVARRLSCNGVRIVLKRNAAVFPHSALWYGRISGTPVYAAFIAKKDTDSRIIGYIGEAFILECTAMGLGTCWLGASYKKSVVAETVRLDDDEYISCITPIGIPDEAPSKRQRKPLSKLTGLYDDELVELPDWQKAAISCARIAPSALNSQPWKFILAKDSVTVKCISPNFGYGMLDCGIAMLHIELGASHYGVTGDWTLEHACATFRPFD